MTSGRSRIKSRAQDGPEGELERDGEYGHGVGDEWVVTFVTSVPTNPNCDVFTNFSDQRLALHPPVYSP